jgi:hypothetical protein
MTDEIVLDWKGALAAAAEREKTLIEALTVAVDGHAAWHRVSSWNIRRGPTSAVSGVLTAVAEMKRAGPLNGADQV